MARHRNVRGYNYDEDFEDDDMYGQSVEDDYGVSPATAAQFIYSKRHRQASCTEPLEEEDDEYEQEDKSKASCTALSSLDQARMFSCLDQMREVLGESVAEQIMMDAVLQSGFDVPKALDIVFGQENSTSKKPADRPGKEALFTSLQHLSNDNPLSSLRPNKPKCTDSSELGFNNPADRQAQGTIFSGVPLDGNRENNLSVFTPTLSLSALINESSQQDVGNRKPVALSQMSLLDLIKPSPCDLDLSTLKPIAQIPDLIQLGHSNASEHAQESKGGVAIGIHSSQATLFPKYIGPENRVLLEKATLFGSLSSVLLSEDSLSSDGENLSVPKYGSPSLADLIQEHKQRNPLQDLVIHSPPQNPCNTDVQTGSLVPLSQLCDGPDAALDIPSLTTSLSSLAVSQSSDQRACDISLSDLIGEANTPLEDFHSLFQSSGVTMVETDLNIDLRSLISEPLGGLDPLSLNTEPTAHEQLEPKPTIDKCMHAVKRPAPKNRKKPGHWVKSLKAKPSTFALSLCFTYIPKACRKSLSVTQAPDYSSTELTLTSHVAPPEIIPFDFQAPSPDDIVKENQKKAFMR